MNSYELHFFKIKVVEHPGFIFLEENLYTFEEKNLDEALKETKRFLKTNKERVLQKLDYFLKNENAPFKITETEKEGILKKYPAEVRLIETITHLIETDTGN